MYIYVFYIHTIYIYIILYVYILYIYIIYKTTHTHMQIATGLYTAKSMHRI